MDPAGGSGRGRAAPLPRATRVRNKQAADQQITAEQILREARELQEQDFKPPTQKITDQAELDEYRLRKRKEFEDTVRRVSWNQGAWVKYATWEENQKDYRRARSVWERALGITYTNPSLWLKYAEMEMRGRFVNHARNVWDRAVSLLPRVDQLWYKYVHMEEMLGNVPGARGVFERWMAFEPDHHGWAAYIKMELRYHEVARARAIYERYIRCLPGVKAYVRYAKFEMKEAGDPAAARAVYERAVTQLADDADAPELYLKFAEFEERAGETERARAIYKYALDHVPKDVAPAVFERFSRFERAHGDRAGIDGVVVGERRFEYEQAVRDQPLNYDAWFEYARLEEGGGDAARVRDLYERAVANLPPGGAKRHWARYVYLWIYYAVWEELVAKDVGRARAVYRAALAVLPHASFTFAKLWVLAAKLEVRQGDLPAARKILGTALGMCPKPKLFKAYIELELALGDVGRARTLHQKFVEWCPASCGAWARFADLEASLGEAERARALYELAVGQPALDAPEVLWKAYIDFEVCERERAHARALYDRLLARTQHVKVWLSYAAFEAAPLPEAEEEEEEEGEGGPGATAEDPDEADDVRAARARSVYERALRHFREEAPTLKEEAVMVLEAWRAFEGAAGGDGAAPRVAAVDAKMPKRIKRKRPAPDGRGGMEEYYDYVFADEGGAAPSLKLLEAAQRWKRAREEAGEAA